MNKKFFLWGATLAAIVFFAGRATAEPSRDFYQEGRAAYERGDYPLAVDRLSEALIRSPADKRAQRLLVAAGQKVMEKQSLDQISLEDLREMVSQANEVLEKRQKEIRRVLDKLKMAQRNSEKLDPQETLRACRGVDLLLEVTLGDDPESRQFRATLRSVCANLKTALDRGILLRPEDEKRILGYVAFCRSDWNAAAASWEEALHYQPKDAHLKDLWTMAKSKQAQQEREEKIVQVLFSAKTAIAAHQEEEAMEILKKALKEFPGEDRLATLFEDTQDQLTERARDQREREWRRKALANQKSGHWLAAAQNWLALLHMDPLHREARENLEMLRKYLETPALPPAVAPDAEAIKQSENFYTVGLIRYAEGDLVNAAIQFRKALEVNPGHDYARKALERVKEESNP